MRHIILLAVSISMQGIRPSCLILMKLEISRQIWEHFTNLYLYTHLSNWSRVILYGETWRS